MTEEELKAACKKYRKIHPYVGCRGCPNYVDVELVQHEQRQSQADRIAELEAELKQVRRERDAAVETWRGFCAKCEWVKRQFLSDGRMDDRCKTCRENNKCNWQWRGVKEGG